MHYDIIAWQIDGMNLALAQSEEGIKYLQSLEPVCQGDDLFLTYLHALPHYLRVGVLDPMGKIHNFSSGVLH